MQNMKITTFLSLLSLISALQWKISPPLVFPSVGTDLFTLSIWSTTEFGQKNRDVLDEDPFFFGLHLNFDGKIVPILGEDFFWFSSEFG